MEEETKSALAQAFSITRGGPFYRTLVRLGHAGDDRRRVVRRALFAILIGWLPLLILSLAQGKAYGAGIKVPFLLDIAVNVRFLIAVPILILAESAIDHRWRLLVQQFLRAELVGKSQLPSFEAVLASTIRLRDAVLPEVLLVVAALLPSTVFRTEILMGSVSNWHATGAGTESMAGWWFILVSAPCFRFLLLRWMWRIFLWTSFLWRVSRINLNLVATHTDMAAGLGFLSAGQRVFSPIVFAGGTVIAAQVANTIAYQGATLSSQKFPMIFYAVLAVVLLVAPLLVVSPVLLKIKMKALLEYGALVTTHNQQFEAKWIRNDSPPDAGILGNPDVSSLCDLGTSFTVVRQMTLVPIDKPTLITLVAASALPMVPVVLYATPADQLIRAVFKMLG